jgi:hypothetical protein
MGDRHHAAEAGQITLLTQYFQARSGICWHFFGSRGTTITRICFRVVSGQATPSPGAQSTLSTDATPKLLDSGTVRLVGCAFFEK